ncbi:LysR family transcriptional regulator [Psychromonas aquimarina]|uniref:LysR family transcriptional regulator n=1 Tax=Psychromonas aquimarina TaxID=444919 RepID=UPI000412C86A|nr:LysR family transcriptional regulator [Psychromonas aquimarina]
MDFNLIKAFIVTFEVGTMTKSSELMGVSQQAVSASIKRLEEVMNEKLFLRKGRSIEPTYAAETLYQKLKPVSSMIENAVTIKERLSVACSEILLDKLSDLDEIKLKQTEFDRSLLDDDLRYQRTDIVIDIVNVLSPGYVAEPVYEDSLVVICQQEHPRIHSEISKEQLYQEQFVTGQMRLNGRTGFEIYAREVVNERKEKVLMYSTANVMMLVSQTHLLATVSEYMANKWADKLGLKVLPCPVDLRPITFSMMYHQRYQADPFHMKVREKIKSCFK